MVKNLPARQETRFDPWVRQIPYAVGRIGKKKKTQNCRSRKLQGVKPLSPWSPFSFKNTTPSPFFDDLNLSQGPFQGRIGAFKGRLGKALASTPSPTVNRQSKWKKSLRAVHHNLKTLCLPSPRHTPIVALS